MLYPIPIRHKMFLLLDSNFCSLRNLRHPHCLVVLLRETRAPQYLVLVFQQRLPVVDSSAERSSRMQHRQCFRLIQRPTLSVPPVFLHQNQRVSVT